MEFQVKRERPFGRLTSDDAAHHDPTATGPSAWRQDG
jgi:hypothetical protein